MAVDSRVLRPPLWYKDAVIYEVHVRAFADSSDDGIGDFPGLTSRLDYLSPLASTRSGSSRSGSPHHWSDGRYTPSSMYRSWKQWSFADKQHQSPWITMLVQRIQDRTNTPQDNPAQARGAIR